MLLINVSTYYFPNLVSDYMIILICFLLLRSYTKCDSKVLKYKKLFYDRYTMPNIFDSSAHLSNYKCLKGDWKLHII